MPSSLPTDRELGRPANKILPTARAGQFTPALHHNPLNRRARHQTLAAIDPSHKLQLTPRPAAPQTSTQASTQTRCTDPSWALRGTKVFGRFPFLAVSGVYGPNWTHPQRTPRRSPETCEPTHQGHAPGIPGAETRQAGQPSGRGRPRSRGAHDPASSRRRRGGPIGPPSTHRRRQPGPRRPGTPTRWPSTLA